LLNDSGEPNNEGGEGEGKNLPKTKTPKQPVGNHWGPQVRATNYSANAPPDAWANYQKTSSKLPHQGGSESLIEENQPSSVSGFSNWEMPGRLKPKLLPREKLPIYLRLHAPPWSTVGGTGGWGGKSDQKEKKTAQRVLSEEKKKVVPNCWVTSPSPWARGQVFWCFEGWGGVFVGFFLVVFLGGVFFFCFWGVFPPPPTCWGGGGGGNWSKVGGSNRPQGKNGVSQSPFSCGCGGVPQREGGTGKTTPTGQPQGWAAKSRKKIPIPYKHASPWWPLVQGWVQALEGLHFANIEGVNHQVYLNWGETGGKKIPFKRKTGPPLLTTEKMH